MTLGLLTRSRPDPDEDESPVCRLEHRLQPWSAGLCVPLFALFAAGVPMGGAALRGMFADPVALAVMVGAARRQADRIFGASFLVVTLTPVVRPAGLDWRDMLAVSMLGGVGFTVSLLLAELALPEGAGADTAKAAVLLTSAAASLLAAASLVARGRAHRLAESVPR